jgi:hypothetical protein
VSFTFSPGPLGTDQFFKFGGQQDQPIGGLSDPPALAANARAGDASGRPLGGNGSPGGQSNVEARHRRPLVLSADAAKALAGGGRRC